jgi:hypothetical protein
LISERKVTLLWTEEIKMNGFRVGLQSRKQITLPRNPHQPFLGARIPVCGPQMHEHPTRIPETIVNSDYRYDTLNSVPIIPSSLYTRILSNQCSFLLSSCPARSVEGVDAIRIGAFGFSDSAFASPFLINSSTSSTPLMLCNKY